MSVEVTELVREDICVRHKVKVLLSIALLHTDHVEAAPILAGDLMTLWEMIDFLVLIESLIKIRFATARGPQDIPLVRLSRAEAVMVKDRLYHAIIKP